MYAMIGVLKKPATMDTDAFRKWWREDHAEAARKLPGLRKYTLHPLSHGFDMATGAFTDEPSHDGVAFLWFDDEAAARAAFAGSLGREDRENMKQSPVSALVFCSAETIDVPPLPGDPSTR